MDEIGHIRTFHLDTTRTGKQWNKFKFFGDTDELRQYKKLVHPMAMMRLFVMIKVNTKNH